MTTTIDKNSSRCVVDFSQVIRDFSSISTQMTYITEELADHIRAGLEFLQYPKTNDEIHTASISLYNYDPDDESPDNMDEEMRRRIRTTVVNGLDDVISEYGLRDSDARLLFTGFQLLPDNRTLILTK